MASKRMFAMQIVDSDAFLDMPASTQNLYFHLNMRADDEGFIDNPRKIMRMIGASQDDMNLLITKRFVIHFESGIVVIKHWLIHNYIRQDRLTPTVYAKERDQLSIKDNRSYTESQADGRQMAGKCQADVSIDKYRLDLDKDSKDILSGKPDDAHEKELPGDESKTKRGSIPYAEIVDYLNKTVGASFRSTTKATQEKIKARWNEGYTLDDFQTVVDKKHADSKVMRRDGEPVFDPRYLRPETLFGPKFESYLNQPATASKMQEDGEGEEELWAKYGVER